MATTRTVVDDEIAEDLQDDIIPQKSILTPAQEAENEETLDQIVSAQERANRPVILNVQMPKAGHKTPFLNRSQPGGKFVKMMNIGGILQRRYVDCFGRDLGLAQ